MDEQILPYDILRFDYKERLTDRFLAIHLHRFEMFSRPVALVVIVEIISPWHPASVLGQKIINCLIREFSRSDAQSYLGRFEASLKQANQAVQETLNQATSPVSCVAVLLEADQVHCAGIGTMKFGLYRNGKLATIIGSKNTSSETFTAVTSGDMSANDWLLITNEAFYENLKKLDNRIWSTNDATTLGAKVSELNQFKASQKVAGVLLHFNLESPPVNQTILWDEANQPKTPVLKLVRPKITLPAFTPLVARLGHLVGLIWQIVGQFASKQNKFQKSNRLLAHLPRLNRRGLVMIGVILFLAIIWFSWQKKNVDPPVEAVTSNLLTTLRDKPADQLLEEFNRQFSLTAYKALTTDNKNELTKLLKRGNVVLAELTGATVELKDEIVDFSILKDQLFLIDVLGQTWVSNGVELSQISPRNLITNPISLLALSPTSIVVTDSLGNIWRLDGSNNPPLSLIQDKEMATGPKLVGQYGGNLYLLNQTTKITYRVSNFSGNLSNVAVYNKAESLSKITNPTDIAINGKIIVADGNGLVLEFSKNALAKTKIQLPTVNGPVKIATSEKSPVTVIASGQTLYFTDSSNAITATVFLITDAKITDLAVDSTNPAKVWLAIDKKLYSLNLPL